MRQAHITGNHQSFFFLRYQLAFFYRVFLFFSGRGGGGGEFSSFSLFTRKPPKNWTAPPKLKSWPTRFNPRLVLPFAPFSPLGRVWFFSLKKKRTKDTGKEKKGKRLSLDGFFFRPSVFFSLSLSLAFSGKSRFYFRGERGRVQVLVAGLRRRRRRRRRGLPFNLPVVSGLKKRVAVGGGEGGSSYRITRRAVLLLSLCPPLRPSGLRLLLLLLLLRLFFVSLSLSFLGLSLFFFGAPFRVGSYRFVLPGREKGFRWPATATARMAY